MNLQTALNKYDLIRFKIFSSRYESNIATKVFLSLLIACFTGLMAQVKIYLPWTPVPITGQTFAVLSGVILGSYWGAFSQILYILLGIAGVHWFAGANAGLAVILGPTGGYLFGFVIASFILGYLSDNFVKLRNFLPMLLIMTVVNFGLVFIPGLTGLYFWLSIVKGSSPNFNTLMTMGFIPFIIGDLLKIIIAVGISTIILPKKDFR
jgi:biotin transport system substrate-specific component